MNPSQTPRFDVLGVAVHALSLEEALGFITASRQGNPAGYVCFCTAHGVMEARKDEKLQQAYSQATLVAPDGMPLVWLGRRAGYPGITRVYGPDVMLAVCERGRALGLRHYFYGGLPGVAAQLADKLKARFPGIEIVGTKCPPFRPLTGAEESELAAEIDQTQADLVWVGLGAPRQELFMASLRGKSRAGLLLGVGAAFDFHAGRVKQAPRWMQRGGLEWFYRLCQEPRRLGARYLVGVPHFALAVLWHQLFRRK